MKLLHLPVDVWFAIMQHLSLADLTALHTAFASSSPATPVDLVVINQFAANRIAGMLAFNKCRPQPLFSDNRRCYKFRMANQSAAKCLHASDHASNPFCGCGYDPAFSDAMEFSQTFRSHPHDTTTTDMTIFANDGKPFGELSTELLSHTLGNNGLTELIWALIDFHTNSTGILRFVMNTLETDIEETFSDVSHSPTCVFRTIAHHVSLERVEWVEWVGETLKLRYTEIPKEWYEYWSASGMWAVSTFSKELTTYTHYKSGEIVHEWEWKMTSFKTELQLPILISSGLLGL